MNIHIKCPCCNGMGSEYPDLANWCGYCECKQVVSLYKWLYWKFNERFIWRQNDTDKED